MSKLNLPVGNTVGVAGFVGEIDITETFATRIIVSRQTNLYNTNR
jgi:hypothetical protein